jgi:hypothetical protein
LNKDWQFLFYLLFPIFLILTFIWQKITQEILSPIYLKTAFKKLFQKTIEAPFIKSLILSKIKD